MVTWTEAGSIGVQMIIIYTQVFFATLVQLARLFFLSTREVDIDFPGYKIS